MWHEKFFVKPWNYIMGTSQHYKLFYVCFYVKEINCFFTTLNGIITNFVQFIQKLRYYFFWSKLKMWHSDMVHQSTFIHCTEITFGALEIKKQSLSSMNRLHMCGQIFLLRKIFFAIGTSKYLSSRTITLHVVFNIVHCETLEIAMITTDLFQISIIWVGPI